MDVRDEALRQDTRHPFLSFRPSSETAPHPRSMLSQFLRYLWSTTTLALPDMRRYLRAESRGTQRVEVDVAALKEDYAEAARSAENWQAACEAAERKLAALEEQNHKLRDEKARADGALRDARARGEKLKQRADEAKAESAALRKTVDAAEMEKRAASKSAKEMSTKLEESQRRVESLTQKGKEVSLELKHLRIEHDQLTELLKTVTAELRDAQAYLGTSDSTSDAELKKMVATLNELVYQLAASISSKVATWSVSQDKDVYRRACKRLEGLMGRPPVSFISAPAPQDNAFCAQLGMQALLSIYTQWIVSTWNVALRDPENGVLHRVHAALFEHGKHVSRCQERKLTHSACRAAGNFSQMARAGKALRDVAKPGRRPGVPSRALCPRRSGARSCPLRCRRRLPEEQGFGRLRRQSS